MPNEVSRTARYVNLLLSDARSNCTSRDTRLDATAGWTATAFNAPDFLGPDIELPPE